MSRRRGRENKKVIQREYRHPPNCLCARCLDADTDRVEASVRKAQEKALEDSWEEHNKDQGNSMPNIQLRIKETIAIGPYEGDSVAEAAYVNCAIGLYGIIVPRGRRRK